MLEDAREVVDLAEITPQVTEDTRLAPQRKTDVVTDAADPDDGEAQPGNPPADAVTEP